MLGARYGELPGRYSRRQILSSLKDFSDLTKTIPSSSFRESVYTGSMSDDDRGIVIALLLTIPFKDKVLRLTKCSNWLEVLKAAGIVGPDGWRAGRGTICIANDGHYCRSLAEKAICDWFYSHGVEHDVEPSWPKHPELNPSGMMRADWAVGDVYIEFAGLMGAKEYREKMERKSKLAMETGIRLMVLAPEDLPRLDSALGPLNQR